MIRLKGATREMGIVERASGTANSTHLFNIFSRPTDTCSVMCCFSVNSSITMPAYIHTCVSAREENPTPFHWAVALSRETAANVIIVSMHNGRLIR